MRRFYRSKVFAGYAAAAVLLGAAWVDGVMWKTICRWGDLGVKHWAPGVDVVYSSDSTSWMPVGMTRTRRGDFDPFFELLPSLHWENDSGVSFAVRIPWGGVWLVFLVCSATALRKKWLELKQGGEG